MHPAARDPPVTLGRIPQWTHIWTLGVTMLAKRNGHAACATPPHIGTHTTQTELHTQSTEVLTEYTVYYY